VEEAFDAKAVSIEFRVESSPIPLPRRVTADDGLLAASADFASESVGVLARVGDESLAVGVREKLVGGDHVVTVARCQRDVERAPFEVDDRVDLRGESSSTTTQTIDEDPPFPPAAS
jgi:hypothetical protein